MSEIESESTYHYVTTSLLTIIILNAIIACALHSLIALCISSLISCVYLLIDKYKTKIIKYMMDK